MISASAGYRIFLERNELGRPRAAPLNRGRGQDLDNALLENKRMAGMDGYSRQDLPVAQDFPT